MKMGAFAVLGLLSVCGIAHAGGVQFYGGDFDNRGGLADERGVSVPDAWTFDDFNWAGGTVEQIFANYATSTGSITAMDFEIRSGVSLGNGGTLVASGTTTNYSWLDSGVDVWGFDIYQGTADVTDFALAAGTYHLAVRPAFTGDSARAFVLTTSGANGVGGPLANGNSFFTSPSFFANFISASDPFGGQGTYDFSQGVIGGNGVIVPLPSAAGLGALGLLGLGVRRRR